ncbi:MAG: SPOR domain-containing protein [Bacteroidia bacterium]|nr:SPOR domain-containing protein [Bacteroidia bacterium]
MQIEGYIDELLYRYNCVVVPDFGAFLTQRKPARINRISHTLYPPSKTVSFNEQLISNDGLLISYVAQAEKLSYEEMLGRMKDITSEWKSKLKGGERLSIGSAGKLWANTNGKIQFQPNEKVNFLTSSFGLSSIVHTPATREVLKEEVVALEEKVPFIITQEKRETFNFRPYLKYAAVILLAFSTGVTGFRAFENTLSNSTLVHDNAQEQVNKHIQEATFFDTKPVELAPVKLTVSVTDKEADMSSAAHHVIAGAFRVQANADKKIRQLKRKGYDAYYVGTNPYGLHQVAFSGFDNVDEALEFLTRVKRTESRDAWLLSKR